MFRLWKKRGSYIGGLFFEEGQDLHNVYLKVKQGFCLFEKEHNDLDNLFQIALSLEFSEQICLTT